MNKELRFSLLDSTFFSTHYHSRKWRKFGQVMIRSSSKALWMAVLFIFQLHMISAECLDRWKNISSEPSSPSHFKNRIFFSIFLGVLTGLIGAILFALLLRYFVKHINRTPILKVGPILFSPKISQRTLNSALCNDPQLLGSSPNGKYYKAVLDNALIVAVKRLEQFSGSPAEARRKRRILQELERLACLRHRNLMSLRAYVCQSGVYSLVYDYVPTGSLEDVMKRVRETQLELNWEIRLQIAVGINKGLHYLHFSCDPRRLHYNLKPSNVILNSEFEPRLADAGLGLILPGFVRASPGFNPPECFQNSRYTDKSDIYSFGMILGVLLTGRDPNDASFGSMGEWLRQMQQAGEAREALDESILFGQEDEMLMALRIAVVCLSDLPADRPSSDELLSMLTQLSSF